MSSMVRSDRGAVSIFVVVFTALLITVVTVSFARLMLREQQRASNLDLSQSAYDAALAGVEDAKRALSAGGSTAGFEDCNGISGVLGGTPGQPVQVGHESLQQRYTCVKVKAQTDDYRRTIGADEQQLIALKGVGAFDQVKIEWYSKDDLGSYADNIGIVNDADKPLSQNWPENRPSVLETQMIQTRSNFNLDSFKYNQQESASGTNPGKSNTNTLFLYPMKPEAPPTPKFIDNARIEKSGAPTPVSCVTSLGSSEYACSVTISLPYPVDGSSNAHRTNAFLRIASRYKGTHYRIVLENSGNPIASRVVQFDGVQPEVDSTGQSGDLFRRVRARIEAGDRFPYPEAAVDVTGNFCKSFTVTNSTGDYASQCTP